jgi:multiple sugar transport system substrate-binding protein
MTVVNAALNRRRFLQLAAWAGSSALLAACAPAVAPAAPTSSTEGTAPAFAFDIPDSGASIPTEAVTLRWTESSQFSRAFMPQFFEVYQQKYPNITVQYDNLPDTELATVLQLAFQSGSTPDVFRLLPDIIEGAQAVAQELVQPLDEVIPNFEAWKAAFPPGSFTEGVNVFNGKTYTFPMLGRFSQVLQYNRSYMEAAGFDPATTPLTWDTFREVAQKITEAGAGAYFGLAIGGSDIGRWSSFVNNFAMLAGAPGGEFNYLTGDYNYTSEPYLATLDLLLALKADGSVVPGAVSLNSDQARAMMPQGQAGMIINETGIVPFWIAESPDFDFDISRIPAPDAEPAGYVNSGPPGGFYWLAAGSEHPEIAADVFAFIGSEEGQKTWQSVGGGALPVIFPAANQVETLDARLRRGYAIFDETMRIGPDPAVRNSDASLVRQEMRPLQPNFGSLIQGIFTGQVTDPQAAMQDLQDRANAELDRAIEAAVAKGAEVSRDDWLFPNWDPSVNYTEAEYAAL